MNTKDILIGSLMLEKLNNNKPSFPKEVREIVDLIEWRDSAKYKKKARAIQRIIDRKYSALSTVDKIALSMCKVSAW